MLFDVRAHQRKELVLSYRSGVTAPLQQCKRDSQFADINYRFKRATQRLDIKRGTTCVNPSIKLVQEKFLARNPRHRPRVLGKEKVQYSTRFKVSRRMGSFQFTFLAEAPTFAFLVPLTFFILFFLSFLCLRDTFFFSNMPFCKI